MSKEPSPKLDGRTKGERQRFIILLPDAIAEQIRALANEGRRPLNTQFEILLEQALMPSTEEVAA